MPERLETGLAHGKQRLEDDLNMNHGADGPHQGFDASYILWKKTQLPKTTDIHRQNGKFVSLISH